MSTDEKINTTLANLIEVDDDTLLEQLGIRATAVTLGAQDMGYGAEPTYDVHVMGPMDNVRALGRRVFDRWNRELYKVMCGSETGDANDRESLLKAIGASDVALAAAMTAFLVGSFAMAPAIATVIAALVVKRIVGPAGEVVCKFWGEELEKA